MRGRSDRLLDDRRSRHGSRCRPASGIIAFQPLGTGVHGENRVDVALEHLSLATHTVGDDPTEKCISAGLVGLAFPSERKVTDANVKLDLDTR